MLMISVYVDVRWVCLWAIRMLRTVQAKMRVKCRAGGSITYPRTHVRPPENGIAEDLSAPSTGEVRVGLPFCDI